MLCSGGPELACLPRSDGSPGPLTARGPFFYAVLVRPHSLQWSSLPLPAPSMAPVRVWGCQTCLQSELELVSAMCLASCSSSIVSVSGLFFRPIGLPFLYLLWLRLFRREHLVHTTLDASLKNCIHKHRVLLLDFALLAMRRRRAVGRELQHR